MCTIMPYAPMYKHAYFVGLIFAVHKSTVKTTRIECNYNNYYGINYQANTCSELFVCTEPWHFFRSSYR